MPIIVFSSGSTRLHAFLDLFPKDPVNSFLGISPVSFRILFSKLVQFKDTSETCPLFLMQPCVFTGPIFHTHLSLNCGEIYSGPVFTRGQMFVAVHSFCPVSHTLCAFALCGSAGWLATSWLLSLLLLFISEGNCYAMERQLPKFLVGKDRFSELENKEQGPDLK